MPFGCIVHILWSSLKYMNILRLLKIAIVNHIAFMIVVGFSKIKQKHSRFYCFQSKVHLFSISSPTIDILTDAWYWSLCYEKSSFFKKNGRASFEKLRKTSFFFFIFYSGKKKILIRVWIWFSVQTLWQWKSDLKFWLIKRSKFFPKSFITRTIKLTVTAKGEIFLPFQPLI